MRPNVEQRGLLMELGLDGPVSRTERLQGAVAVTRVCPRGRCVQATRLALRAGRRSAAWRELTDATRRRHRFQARRPSAHEALRTRLIAAPASVSANAPARRPPPTDLHARGWTLLEHVNDNCA